MAGLMYDRSYITALDFTVIVAPPLRVSTWLLSGLISRQTKMPERPEKSPVEKKKSAKMEEKPTEISSSKMFGGYNKRYKHFSPTLDCSMTFHIYFPPSSSANARFPDFERLSQGAWNRRKGWRRQDPCSNCLLSLGTGAAPGTEQLLGTIARGCNKVVEVLYWLSGLTCSDENFIIKSGAQRAASSEGVALIAPDTSPRGLNVEGESDSWDFGVGAGFYLNATQEKWKNWRMYDYVVKELPKVLSEHFQQLDTSRASISGHSMGGHGALTIFLKNLDKYKSVSAFAPISNPISCPWGQKAFSNYLGGNKSDWEEYDASCLVGKSSKILTPILIDQDFAEIVPRKFCVMGFTMPAMVVLMLLMAETDGYSNVEQQVSLYDNNLTYPASNRVDTLHKQAFSCDAKLMYNGKREEIEERLRILSRG
ncbi:hypothetical protein ACLOJK_019885 [Asimina triloba]